MWVGTILHQYVCTSSYVSPPPPVCSAITAKLEELRETTKSLCGTNATESLPVGKIDYRKLVTWTSVARTEIGNTNFRSTGTLTFEIPDIIPDDAIEVLVYAYFRVGTSSGSESHFKIYTEGDEGEEYAKYISLFPSNSRNHWDTNSDNMWFPMTSSRRIFLNVPSALSININGFLHAIGYR